MLAQHSARAQAKNTAHAVSTILNKAKINRMPNPLRVHLPIPHAQQAGKQNRVQTASRVSNLADV
jgi:predicted DsbA family dithiol-disulfide isomerase